MSTKHNKKIVVRESSGNVFADMGLPDSEELMAKSKLAYRISVLIDRAGLNQTQAAARLGVGQPQISLLRRGRLKDFSIERLMKFLNALDQDVVLTVRKARRGHEAAVLVEA